MTKIRLYEPSDLEELYMISLQTGDAGSDATNQYDNKRLIGNIYAAPYARLQPNLALVVTDHMGVAGYVLGVSDTLSWEAKLEREWWPRLRTKYSGPPLGDQSLWTADQHRIATIFTPELTPSEVAADFRGHLHLNLLPRVQHRGIGTELLAEWIRIVAVTYGTRALHVGVNRRNLRGLAFWRRRDFAELQLKQTQPGRKVWLGRYI